MDRFVISLLLLTFAAASVVDSSERRVVPPEGAQGVMHPSRRGLQARKGPRKQLSDIDGPAEVGGTFVPDGGKGSWESGGSTGIIMIHANLMKEGEIVAWSSVYMGLQPYGSTVYDPYIQTYRQLLDRCGIHDCRNSFCGAHTTTANNEVLIFGGHARDINWFRAYSHDNHSLWSMEMSSGRWYPGVATLADGRVLVVGGVNQSGKAGYHITDRSVDNPTYAVYDPATGSFGRDRWDMSKQLSAAFPIHTYPHVHVLPDGGVIISAGSSLVRYDQAGPTRFEKNFSYPDRPGAPWSYPQTGIGILLPMHPPYDQLFFLASGGVSEDRARKDTPASNRAHVIQLTAGSNATWQNVGPMPYQRVMGDAVILCDGTVGFFGGAGRGTAGWSKEARRVEHRDGSSWWCPDHCSKAADPVYSPSIFDPATGLWSERGSLEEMMRPRLYHSTTVLLPDCRVLMAGSDVTNDKTAEIYSPPYLSRGPQPRIVSAPSTAAAGSGVEVEYSSRDVVRRALLIRTAAVTHSMAFDARALWLNITADSSRKLTVAIPVNRNVVPPGMYMLVLLSDKGVPSHSKIVSIP